MAHPTPGLRNRRYLDHVAIQRLRRNQPLTETDLSKLERMLLESGTGTAEDLKTAAEESHGLGLFIRSLLGLDRQAALDALAGFVDGKELTAAQLHFVDMIVQHLTEHGSMPVAALYESPFSDVAPNGPEDLFGNARVDVLNSALKMLERSAQAG